MSRWAVRKQAWVALLAFVASLSLPLIASKHLAFDDDAACEPSVFSGVSGPHAFSQVDIVHSAPPATHCALCHWLRAVGGARTNASISAASWLEPASIETPAVPTWHGASPIVERPSRAPPSLLA